MAERREELKSKTPRPVASQMRWSRKAEGFYSLRIQKQVQSVTQVFASTNPSFVIRSTVYQI